MKRAKYLTVLFAGTLVYVVLSLCFGQNSLRCYSQMEEQKRIVSKQKAEIQSINTELTLELSALKNDKAVIAAYARKMDYVSDDEKLVKITGLKPYQNALYDTGTVVRHQEPEFVSEKICKMAGITAALLVLLFMIIYDFKKGNIVLPSNKKVPVTGVPVYKIS
ncbi:MAG: septum formation initiator family protein [Treponema sp.]|nr:septum formation initiator family protein [Treponema sp.]